MNRSYVRGLRDGLGRVNFRQTGEIGNYRVLLPGVLDCIFVTVSTRVILTARRLSNFVLDPRLAIRCIIQVYK